MQLETTCIQYQHAVRQEARETTLKPVAKMLGFITLTIALSLPIVFRSLGYLSFLLALGYLLLTTILYRYGFSPNTTATAIRELTKQLYLDANRVRHQKAYAQTVIAKHIQHRQEQIYDHIRKIQAHNEYASLRDRIQIAQLFDNFHADLTYLQSHHALSTHQHTSLITQVAKQQRFIQNYNRIIDDLRIIQSKQSLLTELLAS
jgi:hypothetical protein